MIGVESDLVGVGTASAQVDPLSKPYDVATRAPYRGSRSELMEVFDLARAGLVHVATEHFSLDEAPEAYRRLHDRTLRGRAVVDP